MANCPVCDQSLQTDADACADCGRIVDPGVRCDAHPAQPAVARCAVCRTAVCRACATQWNLRNFCPRHHGIEVIDGHVELRRVPTQGEAALVRSLLEDAGIPTWIHDQKASAHVVNVGALSPVKILVPRDRLDDALAVLQDADAAEFAIGLVCEKCGRPLDDAALPCPDCDRAGHRR